MALNKKMEELKTQLEAASAKVVNLHNTHAKKKDRDLAKKAATNALNEYNRNLAIETFKRWDAEGTPVMTAIRTMFIPHALKCNYKEDDDGMMTCTIQEDPKYRVDFPLLQATIGAKKFANPDWLSMITALWQLRGSDINERFGSKNAEFNADVDGAIKLFSFPEGVNPLSPDGIIHALQKIFDAILYIDDGEGKNLIHIETKKTKSGETYSEATEFLVRCMTGKGSEMATVKVVGPGAKDNYGKTSVTSMVFEAMHTILTGGDFGVEYEK